MPSWTIDPGPPRAGDHYPRNLDQFMSWFPTDADARSYLSDVRFAAGAACPRCGVEAPESTRDRWWCNPCRRFFTVTTRTVMERTKVPLRIWLLVAWYICQTKVGVSALSVERITGVSYTTAWSLLQKMRGAMDQGPRDRLRGDVEFDEAFLGGKSPGHPGHPDRAAGKKQVVAIACEHLSGTAMGRIRMARLPGATALALADFLEANVEPGSILLSDDWVSYTPALGELAKRGIEYTHKATNLSKSKEKAHVVLPHVHRVAALLKRWDLGTHQGAIEGPHLDAYLDEFTFRYNRRHARNRGLIFWRLVSSLCEAPPLTRAELGQRRPLQKASDDEHDRLVEKRLAEREAEGKRRRYRTKTEEAGREVRAYRRRSALDPRLGPDSGATTPAAG